MRTKRPTRSVDGILITTRLASTLCANIVDKVFFRLSSKNSDPQVSVSKIELRGQPSTQFFLFDALNCPQGVYEFDSGRN